MTSGLKPFLNSKIKQHFLKGIFLPHRRKPKTQLTSKHCRGCLQGSSSRHLQLGPGLFLTAVEPRNRNQLRCTAEPWLGLCVCVWHTGLLMNSAHGERQDRCALSLSGFILPFHWDAMTPQLILCSQLRSYKAKWFCPVLCQRGCPRQLLALRAERRCWVWV